jgi:hypothetical protein
MQDPTAVDLFAEHTSTTPQINQDWVAQLKIIKGEPESLAELNAKAKASSNAYFLKKGSKNSRAKNIKLKSDTPEPTPKPESKQKKEPKPKLKKEAIATEVKPKVKKERKQPAQPKPRPATKKKKAKKQESSGSDTDNSSSEDEIDETIRRTLALHHVKDYLDEDDEDEDEQVEDGGVVPLVVEQKTSENKPAKVATIVPKVAKLPKAPKSMEETKRDRSIIRDNNGASVALPDSDTQLDRLVSSRVMHSLLRAALNDIANTTYGRENIKIVRSLRFTPDTCIALIEICETVLSQIIKDTIVPSKHKDYRSIMPGVIHATCVQIATHNKCDTPSNFLQNMFHVIHRTDLVSNLGIILPFTFLTHLNTQERISMLRLSLQFQLSTLFDSNCANIPTDAAQFAIFVAEAILARQSQSLTPFTTFPDHVLMTAANIATTYKEIPVLGFNMAYYVCIKLAEVWYEQPDFSVSDVSRYQSRIYGNSRHNLYKKRVDMPPVVAPAVDFVNIGEDLQRKFKVYLMNMIKCINIPNILSVLKDKDQSAFYPMVIPKAEGMFLLFAKLVKTAHDTAKSPSPDDIQQKLHDTIWDKIKIIVNGEEWANKEVLRKMGDSCLRFIFVSASNEASVLNSTFALACLLQLPLYVLEQRLKRVITTLTVGKEEKKDAPVVKLEPQVVQESKEPEQPKEEIKAKNKKHKRKSDEVDDRHEKSHKKHRKADKAE